MKSIQFRDFGPPGVLAYTDCPKPQPGYGQVLVKTKSISVNFADIHMRKGIYPMMPELAIPGLEASGVVEATGDGVGTVSAGQAVMIFGHHCYADYVVVDQSRVTVLPDEVDWDQAAVLQIAYLTAFQILFPVARIQAGGTLLLYAAAGGVGTAAVQLAKLAGATVIGLTSSAEKAGFACAQGADHIIDYRKENLVERVEKLTGGRGVDVIMDSVQGKQFERNFEMLAPFGHLVVFGAAAGPSGIDVMKTMRTYAVNSPTVSLFNLFTLFEQPHLKAASVTTLLRYLKSSKIRPAIYKQLPLKEAAEAHRLLESGAVTGKIILKP